MLARAPGISLFGSLLASLIGLAWLALVVWGSSPYGRYLDHKNLDAIRIEGGGTLLVFVLGWVLMTVAMMLPTSLPLVTLFRGMVHRRAERAQLLSLLLLGYLGSGLCSAWWCTSATLRCIRSSRASRGWPSTPP